MTRPLLLSAYRLATTIAEPAAPLLLAMRGDKEDRARRGERRGVASIVRPDKPIIWLHGASIGELMSALPLVTALRDKGAFILLTSGTRSSAGVLAEKIDTGELGPDIVHQFVPLDFPRGMARFLDHWQPDLALFMEQEIWPNMLAGCKAREIPAVLINGRLSQHSFERWQKRATSADFLLGHFELCLAQSDGDAERFEALGVDKAYRVGNLKVSDSPANYNKQALEGLRQMLGNRLVWLAAATHPGEEQIVAETHLALAKQFPDLLTFLVPRHAERGDEILAMLGNRGLCVARRSLDEKITSETNVYLADTFGELSLFFAAVPMAFIGGSLVPIGGHNPIEAIVQDCAVLYGPHISNFIEVYGDLGQDCIAVQDGAALSEAVAELLGDPARVEQITRSARDRVRQMSGALAATLEALSPFLARMGIDR